MSLFEHRFRNQFSPDGEGVHFRRGRHARDFTLAEYETFVAQRRRVWGNPVLWSAYALGGLALPAWLIVTGAIAAGWTIAAVALLYFAVMLINSTTRALEAAISVEERAPAIVTGSAQSPIYYLAISTVLLTNAARVFLGGHGALWEKIFSGVVLVTCAIFGALALYDAWKAGKFWWCSRAEPDAG